MPSPPPSRHPGRPLALLSLALCVGLWAGIPRPTIAWLGIFPLGGLAVAAAARGWGRTALGGLILTSLLLGAATSPPVHRAWPGLRAGACARALAKAGLPPPTEEAAARLQLEGAIGTVRTWGDRSRAVLLLDRGRPAPDPEALAAGAWVATSRPLPLEVSFGSDLRPLPGDRIRATVVVDDPPPLGPASRRAYLGRQRRGVACVGRVEGDQMAVLSEGRGWRVAVEASRRRLADAARATLPDPVAQALVPALMVGDRSIVPDDLQEDFAASGLAHLLSVSGLHLSLAVLGSHAIARWLLQRLVGHRLDAPRLAAALAIPLAPLYAVFTGAQPPVIRAAVGAGLFLLARAVARGADGWTTLAIAAAGIVAWDPATLFEPSFQLSFAACMGLVGLAPGLQGLLPRRRRHETWSRRWLRAVATSLFTTLAATLATLPLTAHLFHRVSLASLLANLVAVPLALAATGLCALCGAVGLVAPETFVALLPLAALPVRWLAAIASWFASWRWASVPMPVPTPWEWGWMVAGLVSLSGALRRPGRWLPCLALCGACLVGPRLLPAGPVPLRVDFLPVGQGDATLLRLPGGEAVLIDTGGDLRGEVDRARGTLLPLLAERGVTRLHALVLSHLHPDHVGSAPTLLRSLPVREVWFTGRPLEGRPGAPIAAAIAERGIRLRRLHAGAAPIRIGAVSFHPLGPPSRDGLGDDPLLGDNDASLVLLVRHGAVRMLFPGDVEREGEAALVAADVDLRADLLKAPHHGSRTSSTAPFLDRVRPEHVVFCVGWRNQFGFPHDDVAERYRRRGVVTHRTDTGAVAFQSDGRALTGPPTSAPLAASSGRPGSGHGSGHAGAPPNLHAAPRSRHAGALLEHGQQHPVVAPQGGEDHRPADRADQIDRHPRQQRADLDPVDAVPAALHLAKERPGRDPLVVSKADFGREVAGQEHREEQRHQHRAQVGPHPDPGDPGQDQEHRAPDHQPENRRSAEERSRAGGGVLPLHGIQGAHGGIMTKAPGGCTPARGTTARTNPRSHGGRERSRPGSDGRGVRGSPGWVDWDGSCSCCSCPASPRRSPCCAWRWRRGRRRCASPERTCGTGSSTGRRATSGRRGASSTSATGTARCCCPTAPLAPR